MKIRVMNRQDAFVYCCFAHDSPVVMISVTDPFSGDLYRPKILPDNNVKDILYLSFSDAAEPGFDARGNRIRKSNLMTDTDANRIARFLERNKGIDIIVHCENGISASAGIAAAIMQHYTGNADGIFQDSFFHPNMLCFEKTLNALKNGAKH